MEQTQVVEVSMVKSKKKPDAVEVPTGVRLGEQLRSEVDALCEAQGIPMGTFIREAVELQVKNGNPERPRQVLLRSLAITETHFEQALKLGVLKGTEAEEQADEIRRFFGQFAAVLKPKAGKESK